MQPNPRLLSLLVNLDVSLAITAVAASATSFIMLHLAGTG